MKVKPKIGNGVVAVLSMAVIGMVSTSPVLADPAQPAVSAAAVTPSDLTELPLEQLMNITVTSVAKKPQKLSDAAAAITVITQEDIRRSGMTTIPELLRMVPGMDVQQINSNLWSVSARGFSNRFDDKLLVLIDGRSVFSPSFSGVNWDVQNVMLEDVDRIEVIRGPGGSLWGANAVNGVINIITKNASDTQGGLARASAGNVEQADGALRYGGKLGNSGYFRVFGQGFKRGQFNDVTTGADAHDGWDGKQIGFRFDSTPTNNDTVMLQGNAYDQDSHYRTISTSLSPLSGAIVDNTDRNRGGHGLLRWDHRLANGSDATLQMYYDRADRDRTAETSESIETYDVDFQHQISLGDIHQFVWGLGYRHVESAYENGAFPFISVIPARRGTDLYSAFVQDEIALRSNLHLTVGSKFEHNSFTGFEYQPGVRLLWQPIENQTLWAAVSRAVRMPALSNTDIALNLVTNAAPPSPAILVNVLGNRDFKSEEVLAFETGYRGEVSRRLTLDVAGFYNRYNRLLTIETGAPAFEFTPAPPHLLIPTQIGNLMDGETYGVEVSAKWQVTEHWRLSPGYTWLEAQMHLDPASVATLSERQGENNNPAQQFQLLSRLDLPHNLEFDTSLYYVDALPTFGVPSYTRLDLRLGWHPIKDLEFSLVGQNLLDRDHLEFSTQNRVDAGVSTVPRSFYGQVTWRF